MSYMVEPNKFLLVDAGHTAIKLATLDRLGDPVTLYYRDPTGDFRAQLRTLLKDLSPLVAIGCLPNASPIAEQLETILKTEVQYWERLRSEIAFECHEFTLKNGYSDPSSLGSDRWYAALGALKNIKKAPLVIAQLGTATTVDVVKKISEGVFVFEGGHIVQGFEMMLGKLVEEIPSLQRVPGHIVPIPQSTADAIRTGACEAQIGVILRTIQKLGLPTQTQIAIGGGASLELLPVLSEVFPSAMIKSDWVLEGLALKAYQIRGELDG